MNQFLNSVLNKTSVAFLLFVLSTSFNVRGQVLVAGTTFTPNPNAVSATKTYYAISDISQYGMITGAISVTPPFPASVPGTTFNTSTNYAITTNPANLDKTEYVNLTSTNYMFVASSPASVPANILSYTVPGLVPGSNVTANITYCNVISTTNASCTGNIASLRGVLNPDAYNTKNGVEGMPQLKPGQCMTTPLTITQATSNSAVVGSDGVAHLYINNVQAGPCVAIGISKIEIFGTPQPVAVSSEGTEVCTGEQTILSLKQGYDASATYQWQSSTNGTSWSNIGGATNSAYLLTAGAAGTTLYYRAQVTYGSTTYSATPVKVTSITCCVAGGSRQTIYYDDFGTLDLANDPSGKTYYVWDYTDPRNPVKVKKTTTTPFRWPLATAPPGTTFIGTGYVDDNQYTVAAGLTGYNPYNGYTGAMLQWAGDIGGFTSQPEPAYDHSGDFTGAALFINVPAHTKGQVIYSRPISNLCANKQIFFSAWINVFTSGCGSCSLYYPVDLQVKLVDGSNPANFVTSNATAEPQALGHGGGPWVEITGTLTLGPTSNSVIMQLINNSDDPATGDDLVLDDIKVMACASPSVNIVFDKTKLTTHADVCTSNMNLFALYPTSLPTYYGGSPYYLFQYSYTPNDNTSWQNIGSPQSLDNYTMTNPKGNSIFTGIPASAKGQVYFRVVVAAQSTFAARSNFTGSNYATQTDVCQNYSVSDPISADVICPLPVTFASFTGFRQDGVTHLQWATSSEKNNSYFVVEKSADGISFSPIDTVAGKGNSELIQLYYSIYANAFSGITYYRLKQVDINGASAYSNTIVVSGVQREMHIFPNPNNGSFVLTGINSSSNFQLDISDVEGKVVHTQSGTTPSEALEIKTTLPNGFYLVRVYLDNEVLTQKIIIY